MSMIQGKTDVSNEFLSRREITCDFNGLGGKLTKLDAVDMVTKEYGLDGKAVIPVLLKNHIGMTRITGTFYVYEDEVLAKSHLLPKVFSRFERAKSKLAEKADAEAKKAEETKAEDKPAEEKKDDVKAEEKPKDEKKDDAKAEDKPAEEASK